MTALTSYFPTLASYLGRTPAQLYERQRALIRDGLLISRAGRGPGSGVEATGEAVGLLLLTTMSSDLRAEAIGKTKALANAKVIGGGVCPVSKAKTLLDALAKGLDGKVSGRGELLSLEVDRNEDIAVIRWRINPRSIVPVQFSASGVPAKPGLRVLAKLDQQSIDKIRTDLAQFSAE